MSAATETLNRNVLRLRLVAVLTSIVVLTVAVMSLWVVQIFDRAIAPELENRTRLIGAAVRSDLQRFVRAGIALDAIGGIETFLDRAVAPFPEIRRVTVRTTDGQLIAETEREGLQADSGNGLMGTLVRIDATRFTLPIIVGNQRLGEVLVEGSPQFVQTRLRDVFLNVAILSLVVVLLGVEAALVIAATAIWKPYGRLLRLLQDQRAGRFELVARSSGPGRLAGAIERLNEQTRDLGRRLADAASSPGSETGASLLSGVMRGKPVRLRLSDICDVRLVMLLYVTGAEITASFLPLYGARAARPDWISAEVAAVLPIGLYLIAIAVLSPFAGGIVQRFGAKRLFIGTALATVVALCAMGLTGSIFGISFARGAIALFYALATIACQQYALEAETEAREFEEISGGFASSAYFAMVFGGVFCASVIGGIVSSLFSYEVAIFLGAAIVFSSAALGIILMEGKAGQPKKAQEAGPRLRWPARAPLFRCLTLILAVAVPLSATTAVVIWYLTPLLLSAAGHTASEIARVVMLYYLLHVLVGPVSRVYGTGTAAIVVGTLLAGGSLVWLDVSAGIIEYSIAVAGVGVGHALVRAPLLTLVVDLSGSAGGPVNALRGAERLGGLLGLGLAPVLLKQGAAGTAIDSLGILSVAGGLVLFVVSGIIWKNTRRQ